MEKKRDKKEKGGKRRKERVTEREIEIKAAEEKAQDGFIPLEPPSFFLFCPSPRS